MTYGPPAKLHWPPIVSGQGHHNGRWIGSHFLVLVFCLFRRRDPWANERLVMLPRGKTLHRMVAPQRHGCLRGVAPAKAASSHGARRLERGSCLRVACSADERRQGMRVAERISLDGVRRWLLKEGGRGREREKEERPDSVEETRDSENLRQPPAREPRERCVSPASRRHPPHNSLVSIISPHQNRFLPLRCVAIPGFAFVFTLPSSSIILPHHATRISFPRYLQTSSYSPAQPADRLIHCGLPWTD